MFKCWHPKDRARDGIAAVMVHLSFCLLSGILQIRCEMMFTFAGCGMQYSICSDRLKKEKKYYIMVLTISGEGKVAMKKFSTEEITNIISNETNIWEQFKQNMKRWEKKLEVYGINIKLEQYWENNIYDPDEIFNERVEFRAGYQYYCSFVLLKEVNW